MPAGDPPDPSLEPVPLAGDTGVDCVSGDGDGKSVGDGDGERVGDGANVGVGDGVGDGEGDGDGVGVGERDKQLHGAETVFAGPMKKKVALAGQFVGGIRITTCFPPFGGNVPDGG